jgi:hypothetical protein
VEATADDPLIIDAMWRALDLRRAYLGANRTMVAACLAGLDDARIERVGAWTSIHHDELFGVLGEPSMSVRVIGQVAASAPLDVELAATTAVHRVALRQAGFAQAMADLPPLDCVHAVAICTVVMMLEAFGPTMAVARLNAEASDLLRKGYPRPYRPL